MGSSHDGISRPPGYQIVISFVFLQILIAWVPNVLYCLLIGSCRRYLFLRVLWKVELMIISRFNPLIVKGGKFLVSFALQIHRSKENTAEVFARVRHFLFFHVPSKLLLP